MEYNLNIKWWKTGTRQTPDEGVHTELLEHALQRAAEMQAEGYIAGELTFEDDSGGHHAQSYSGWWKLQTADRRLKHLACRLRDRLRAVIESRTVSNPDAYITPEESALLEEADRQLACIQSGRARR